MNEKTSASMTKRWRVPIAKATKLTRGEKVLLEMDRRLWRKASQGFSPSDARFSEQLRCTGETLKPDTSVEDVAVFTALQLSFDLQQIAARLIDEPNSPEAVAARRRVETMWKVASDLDTLRSESQDVRTIFLRLVEAARESELDIATQVKLVIRKLSAVDAAVARKVDAGLLERLLLSWNPKRGRPKRSTGKQDDPFEIATAILHRATGVKIAPGSLRKQWERGRTPLRARI
jgi:hypothetical protein